MNIKKDFPLKNIATLAIGGPAKEFIVVKSTTDLMEAIKYANQNNLKFLLIGGGSNLLVSDEGFNGLIIKNEITGIKLVGNQLIVKSGTPLQELVDFTISKGLAGLQKLTGIPGSVGGAVYGNAGAYGQTISDHLISVKILNTSVIPAQAGIQSKNDCNFNYRDSGFKKTNFPILYITFDLEKDSPKKLAEEASDILTQRLKKYPTGIKCPGSFFKNLVATELTKEQLEKIPAEKIVFGKIPAGVLLEAVGAKEDSLGNIEIADYHANLFINKGGGTAKDFYNLAKKYVKKVKEKFGITLEPEVQLINLPPI